MSYTTANNMRTVCAVCEELFARCVAKHMAETGAKEGEQLNSFPFKFELPFNFQLYVHIRHHITLVSRSSSPADSTISPTFTRHIPSTSTLVSCRRVVQPVECYSAPNHHHHHRQHPSIVSHGVLIHHQKKKSIKPDRIPTLTLVCMKVSSCFIFSFPFFLLSTDAEQTPLLYYSVWAFKLPPVSFIFHHFAFMKSFSSLYTFQFCHSLCAFLLKVKKENCIWNDKMTMETLVASLNSLCAI